MIYARAVAAALFLIASVAHADPADYVKTLSFDPGLEFESKYGTSKLASEQGRLSAGTLGLGYGVTPVWFTEIYVKYQKSLSDKTRFESTEWENKFLLLQSAVDLGLFIELEIPREREEGYEFRLGPLMQAHLGNLQLNTNLFLKRLVRVEPTAGKQETELHYQLQAKYPLRDKFELGVQALGELGKWNHWASRSLQTHRIGPALFGESAFGDDKLRYDVAWLVGASKSAADSTFRIQLEYDF